MNTEIQTIYTNPARIEYSHAAVPTHNPKLGNFVQGPLCECIKAAWYGVANLHYVEDLVETTAGLGELHYSQAVIIIFSNGYRKVANVAGDSEWGCLEDVMKCIIR